MTEKNLLEIRELTKSFGGVTAVQDVSFTMKSSEIVALIGPNGAGKTTVFNMVSGIFPSTSGEIRFKGQNITNRKAYQIAQLGMTRTFQNLQIFQTMNVAENVMTGRHKLMKSGMFRSGFRFKSVYREEEEAMGSAQALLKRLDLEDQAFLDAATLPYGTQRLVEIARAAAAEPSLILLDEPMAGLNPEESRNVADAILRMREDGLAFLFIEHDMETVMSLADKIVVLDNGKKIAEGTPEEISHNQKVIQAYLGEEEDE